MGKSKSHKSQIAALLHQEGHSRYVDLDDEINSSFRLTNGFLLNNPTAITIYYEYDASKADRDTQMKLSQAFDRQNPKSILRKFSNVLDGIYGRIIMAETTAIN